MASLNRAHAYYRQWLRYWSRYDDDRAMNHSPGFRRAYNRWARIYKHHPYTPTRGKGSR